MKLIVEKIKQLDRREIVAYLLVGFLGAAIDFGSFYFLKKIGLTNLLAQWSAGMIGFTHNHLWQHYKVFTHNQSMKKTYTISVVISIISIAVSGPLLVYLMTFGISVWLGKFFVLAMMTIILYIIRKKYIFLFSHEA